MRFGVNCGHTASGVGSGAVGVLNESVETRNVGYALMDILTVQLIVHHQQTLIYQKQWLWLMMNH